MIAYIVDYSSLKMSVEGEGNYASTTVSDTRDQETDQGLTLSPKIPSENPFLLDTGNLTHEDYEQWLGPSELDLVPEEVQEDDSWIDDLFNEPDVPEPPAKRRKITPPPPKINAQEPVSFTLNFYDITEVSQQLGSPEKAPSPFPSSSTQPLKYADTTCETESSRAKVSINQYTPIHRFDTGIQTRSIFPVRSIDTLSNDAANSVQRASPSGPNYYHRRPRCFVKCPPPRKEVSGNKPINIQSHANPSTNTVNQAKSPDSSFQPQNIITIPDSPIQNVGFHPVQNTESDIRQGSLNEDAFDLGGDDGSLFGDEEFEEPETPSYSIDGSTRSSTPQTVASNCSSGDVQFLTSSILNKLHHPPEINVGSAAIYPTPRASPLHPDIAMKSVERNPPQPKLNGQELKRHIHQTCNIPYTSRLAASNYATQKRYYDVIKAPQTSVAPRDGSLSMPPTSFIGLGTSTMAAFGMTPPPRRYNEESIIQELIPHLRARLLPTSSTPHTVPPDLSTLFESLEKKFDHDVNFRNSVLTWAIRKMESQCVPDAPVEQPRTKLPTNKSRYKLSTAARLQKALARIQELTDEKKNFCKKVADLQSYVGYLESVNRSLPKPC